jgi:predicted DNA-binding protein YlxM (UPF0122 family)
MAKDKRYTPGQRRLVMMEYMREHRQLTLREIGEEFGISRERVRQIIGNTGRRGLGDRVREDAEMLRDAVYFEESTTVDKIAKQYRVSKASVSKILGTRWKYLLSLGLRKCYRCHKIMSVDKFGAASSRYKHMTVSGICKECNNAGAKRYYHLKKSKQARAARRGQKAKS